MSLTDILFFIVNFVRRHYIISAFIAFLCIRTVYATVRTHQVKVECLKIAEIILQWWQTPEAQGGYGKKPIEHIRTEKMIDFLHMQSMKTRTKYEIDENVHTYSDVTRDLAEYVAKHFGTRSLVSNILSKRGFFEFIGLKDDPDAIIVMSFATKSWLLYAKNFVVTIKPSGSLSDVKIQTKQHYIFSLNKR